MKTSLSGFGKVFEENYNSKVNMKKDVKLIYIYLNLHQTKSEFPHYSYCNNHLIKLFYFSP